MILPLINLSREVKMEGVVIYEGSEEQLEQIGKVISRVRAVVQ